MKTIENFEILNKAKEYCLTVYKMTSKFPKSEIYGLTSQIQRAAVSVCANFSEGYYRNTDKDFAQFLFIARGSIGELLVLLELSQRLGYLTDIELNNLQSNYRNLLKSTSALIRYLRK
jgi:four helix bundle protein